MEIFFVILFFFLVSPVFTVRTAEFVNTTFWTPYILYVSIQYMVVLFALRYANHRQRSLMFGYSYKFCTIFLKFFMRRVAMKGVRFDKPHDYVCECDKKLPKEEQTLFKVRFLTAEEQAELRDIMYSVSGMGANRSEKFLTGTVANKALEIGLQGWERFSFEDGSDIPFTRENFSAIRPKERDEIANYIRGIEEEE